ncbi:MAG TPA: glucose-6-phosphate dehydrogenase [Kiritimatiellia bacterium]|nr:glucose-6-phosphate dehydrogenase [Kiritimatiellia bacterium]
MNGSAPSASAYRVKESLTIVILGASGDLTLRKLMPALYAMYHHGFMPDDFAIVGFARRDYTTEYFRDMMLEALRKHSRVPVLSPGVQEFLSRLHYHKGDIETVEAYKDLAARMDRDGFPANRLFYFSIKPDLFVTALAHLKVAGLIAPPQGSSWTRVVIEKPFGHDLVSAIELNQVVRRHLDESQIYRIDHYLGKETVQNILSFRFANTIFEPLFNSSFVDNIQITAGETVGMESGRGAYYDVTGAIRDMVQNHLLQLLCVIAMEPPASLTADAIRNEKVKVLQSVRVHPLEDVRRHVIRAQYVAGNLGDKAVPGYLEEERIATGSKTETFVAMRLFIENWRWAGVPVYLRTGKRLPRRTTEIVVNFKVPPLQLFQTVECVGEACDLTRSKPNQVIFRIQPDEGIDIRFSAKRPVLQVQVENVAMSFDYAQTWKTDLPEAYERLLLDVLRGDSTLFTRSDEVETAWRIIDPVLKAWDTNAEIPVYTYPAGTWGPSRADVLLNEHGHKWRNPSNHTGG